MAAQVLAKSMDSTDPNADKYEIGIMQKDSEGKLIQRRVEGAELQKILEEAKVFEKKADK